MPLGFNALLDSAGIDPADVRLLRHQDGGTVIYRMWRDDRATYDMYQSQQGIRDRAFYDSPVWASFVVEPGGRTLFVGLYRVGSFVPTSVPVLCPRRQTLRHPADTDIYATELDPALAGYVGRVVVDWGAGTRSWRQRAARRDKPILEIRREFSEPEFPGFTNLIANLSEVANFPSGWRTTLSAAHGIYLLTCPRTHEQYVGSAIGAQGFWGRWCANVENGHGGNVRLRSREVSDYQVSILEVAGSAATPDDIYAMESRWKQRLQTRAMGLNGN